MSANSGKSFAKARASTAQGMVSHASTSAPLLASTAIRGR